ncbi:hypothetical protein LZ554_007257 [Drepanopeziza brunnea f. sp. 'monogermtubi']|nr:hypothetical protein LZ554_007257 [Drepanopeziza brunnea f. sp. 'monogermtubi']
MASTTQIFDPDGDLTFIIPSGKNAVDITPSSRHRPRKTPTKETHPVFKAMFTGNLAEAVALRDNGTVEVPLPDDNAVVFTILMDSIHSRQRKVPRKVPLKLLGLLYSGLRLRYRDPGTLAQHFMGVQTSRGFSTVTGMLIRGSKDFDASRDMKIRGTEHDLPIPMKILEAIQNKRERAIEALYTRSQNLVDAYTFTRRDNKTKCHKHLCDTIVLGSLIHNFSRTQGDTSGIFM